MMGMWLWWVLAIGLVVVVAWAVVRSTSRTRGGNDTAESPQDILKRRYARGEIDKDEYEKRLQDLRQ